MSSRTPSLLLSALLLLAGSAFAQASGPPPGVSKLPPGSGEASTRVGGSPNANPEDPRINRSREELKAERDQKKADRQAARTSRKSTREMGASPAIDRVPSGSGEASTMIGGRVNANPDDPRINKSREEIMAERDAKKAQRQAARDARKAGRQDAAGAGATR